ncbi:MAG: RdgB/HAM1 family non-canonical purine NTP pyrophosphatase [Bacteroidales bacterium]|nr:RdgB/HAM1 family non-canonical purine NTP pyrophosphatase [Bacteroidales bacterium]
MSMELIFATANPDKLREASEILGKGITLIMPKKLGYKGDIPETGATIEANSKMKCQFIWNKFNKSCFADDTALEVDSLGGAPGVYSARYAGEQHDSKANIAKLLAELEKVDKRKKNIRAARFRTVITLIHKGTLYTFNGVMNGTIAEKESGEGGFGYDSVFIPEGCSCTFAEMSENQKNAISHRGIAMRKLAHFLSQL